MDQYELKAKDRETLASFARLRPLSRAQATELTGLLAKTPVPYNRYGLSLPEQIEVFNDSIVKVWNLAQQHGQIVGDWERYFGGVFKNEARAFIRRRIRDQDLLSDIADLATAPDGSDPEREAVAKGQLDYVVERIDPLYQKVFRLRVAGFSYREISDRLMISEDTARKRFERGRGQAEKVFTRD